jgi:hypothetical protein
VDLQNGTFTAPRDRITKAMVKEIAETNETYLGGAYRKVEMLKRWVEQPDKVREMLTWFTNRLEELMTKSDDPDAALSVVLDEMFARAKETGYAQAMIKGKEATEK